jgi:hypothetical protein
MKAFSKIKDKIFPICHRCNKNHFFNFSARLPELKRVGEYHQHYDSFKKLCFNCWTEMSRFPCSLCETDFDVLSDNKKELLENLKQFNILEKYPKVLDAQHICPKCFEKLQHTECSRCLKVFQSIDNKAIAYTIDSEIQKWLYPNSPFYSTAWNNLCPNCYVICKSACHEIQENIKSWVRGTKYEYIHKFNTVKTLGRIEYKGTLCLDPAQLEERLKIYSVQLGGNGFVKLYYEKNEKRHQNRVIAGYSNNNNPYYRTEYTIERWFTGYATAVIVEASK